jgi:hypothetical protein
MNKVLRKIGFHKFIFAPSTNRLRRVYWSWYERENEKNLLHQLTKILEEDDEVQNIERGYSLN